VGKIYDGYPSAVKTMLERGEDPKELLIEICKPSCKFYEEKLRRCEAVLKSSGSSDPEMTCMYPMRDWVTCIEACVLFPDF
jgi:ubiquinol-cytochrome c reductase subunit 6